MKWFKLQSSLIPAPGHMCWWMLPSCCDARWPSARSVHMSGLVSPHTDTREISTLLGGGGLTVTNERPYGHVGLDLFCASIITCWAQHTKLAPNTSGHKILTCCRRVSLRSTRNVYLTRLNSYNVHHLRSTAWILDHLILVCVDNSG